MAPALAMVLVLLPLVVGECPPSCRCTKVNTKCLSAKLLDIPTRLDHGTKFLTVKYDNISELTTQIFRGETFAGLHTLILEHTQIVNISTESFREMRNLRVLSLNNNKIEVLQLGTFHNLYQLKELDLSHNSLRNLYPGLFQTNSSLSKIDFSHNKIENVAPETFSGMKSLEEIKFRHNEIVAINSMTFEGLTILRNLDIGYNKITFLSPELFASLNTEENLHPVQLLGLHNKLEMLYNMIEEIEPGIFQGLQFFTFMDMKVNLIKELKNNTFLGLLNLKALDLSHNSITIIHPGAFNGLYNLSQLYLGHSNILVLNTNAFEGLLSLKELYLGSSAINVVEADVFNIPTLTNLDLSWNNIRNISCNMFHGMISLQSLDISNNKPITISMEDITEHIGIQNVCVDAFKDLMSLKNLKLNNNNINKFKPHKFPGLGATREVELSSNEIQVLEEFFFTELTNARILLLNVNKIHTIRPSAFSGLRKLKHLDLSRNFIAHLNKDMFVTLDRLEYLDIRGNPIASIHSETFQYLETMTLLGLSVPLSNGSDLTFGNGTILSGTLHRKGYLKQLKICSVNDGGIIQSIQPRAFNDIEISTLDMSRNEIKILKEDMFQGLNSLRVLILSENKLKSIHLGTFRHLNSLRLLKLSNNFINNLQSGIFRELSQLETLDLNNNNIQSIEGHVFGGTSDDSYITSLNKLRKLDLHYNEIATLHPESFYGLQSLEYLDLSSNKILYLPAALLRGLSSLHHVDFHKNNISILHTETFKHNLNLRNLDLSDNNLSSKYFIHNETCKQFGLLASVFENNLKLEKLHIAGNNIKRIDLETFTHLIHLKEFGIQDNPLLCDCQMQKIWDWTIRRKLDTATLSVNMHYPAIRNSTRCNNSNKYWVLTLSNLTCRDEFKLTDSETEDFEKFLFFKRHVEPVVLGTIFLIGAVWNVFLLAIFVLNPEMRSGPNACILNLAVGDLLSLVVNLPINYVHSIYDSWQLGILMCKTFKYVTDLTVGITVFSVVALGLQRYGATVKSFPKRKSCQITTDKYIISIWVLALGLAVPSFILATVEDRCLSGPAIHENNYTRVVWFTLTQLAVYCVVPICTIVYVNIRIACHLVDSAQNVPGESTAADLASGRSRAARMVVVLMAVFCLSYGPTFIVRALLLWPVLDHHSEVTLYIGFVCYCLFFCNACFNPIALYCMSTTFRNLFKKYLTCGRSASSQ
ncbi:slit homolog 2 protein-like [Periplaneta americana]|uniref:slit homolog 2 protein-like n=1 Tax=Periplaneta americana TaxID=6978 RepID=UPI0037E7DBC8